MGRLSVPICVFTSIELIIYIITSIGIQKYKNNIFLSIRSTNVLQVINANIFLSICVFFTTIFDASNILSIFQSLLIVFHIITIFSFLITI